MLTYLPALTALAAVVLTYVFCVRPMVPRCCGQRRGGSDAQTALELERARAELELLRLRQTSSERLPGW